MLVNSFSKEDAGIYARLPAPQEPLNRTHLFSHTLLAMLMLVVLLLLQRAVGHPGTARTIRIR